MLAGILDPVELKKPSWSRTCFISAPLRDSLWPISTIAWSVFTTSSVDVQQPLGSRRVWVFRGGAARLIRAGKPVAWVAAPTVSSRATDPVTGMPKVVKNAKLRVIGRGKRSVLKVRLSKRNARKVGAATVQMSVTIRATDTTVASKGCPVSGSTSSLNVGRSGLTSRSGNAMGDQAPS